MDPLLVGRHLRARRKAAGLTLDELGARVGLAPSQLSMVENGRREPRLSQLDALAEDMRFRKLMVDASLVVDDLRVTSGYTAAGIEQTMPLYVEAVGRVPQMA